MSGHALLLLLAVCSISAAQECRPGKIRVNGQCKDCPAGTTKGEFESECTKCPPGTFSPFKGARSEEICRPCLEDTFAPEPGATACRPCPPGTISNRGARKCLACGPGTEIGRGGSRCRRCERGHYSNSTLTRMCDPCPFPLTARPGSDSIEKCRPCPPGRQGSRCILCEEGFFKPRRKGICERCPPGSTAPDGARFCRECKAGKFEGVDRRGNRFRVCIDCPPGTTSERGANVCRQIGAPCPEGSFEKENGACIRCREGSFINTRTKRCEKCPPGSASPGGAQTKCDVCTNGLIPDFRNNVCRCPQGFFLEGKSTCKPCPAGTGGNFATPERRGRDGCIRCNPGTFAKAGSPSCTKCPFGFVAPNFGATSCEPCPADTAPAFDDSEEPEFCEALSTGCPLGFRVNGGWGAFCKRVGCQPGTPKEEIGKTCVACGAGEFVDENSNKCRVCKFDEFSVDGVVNKCSKCPDGKVRNSRDDSKCTCTGERRNASGLNEKGVCEPCPPGTFNDAFFDPLENFNVCTPCPVGMFTDRPSQSFCKECGFNTFSDAPGASECKPCPNGTAGNLLTGSTKCVNLL